MRDRYIMHESRFTQKEAAKLVIKTLFYEEHI